MGDVEQLTFRRPDGSETVWDAEMDPGQPEETANFRTLRGRYQNYPFAIRYAIGGERSELAVENAIATGLRLLRRYGAEQHYPWEQAGQAYPWELSRLLGYDVDCEIPFVVTLEYGTPLNRLPGPLSPEDTRRLATGLARGLYLLDRLGVVHRQLLGNTLHWDSRSQLVQINRFEYARRPGDPRYRLQSDWAAPEQRAGRGYIESRDDVFGAGCAILAVTAHGLRLGPDGLPNPAASGVPWLPTLLAGVFGPVEARPTAATLLQRLGRPDMPPDPPRADPDTLLEPGRAAFDRLIAAKLPPPDEPPPPPSMPPPQPVFPPPSSPSRPSDKRGRRGRRGWPSLFAGLPLPDSPSSGSVWQATWPLAAVGTSAGLAGWVPGGAAL